MNVGLPEFRFTVPVLSDSAPPSARVCARTIWVAEPTFVTFTSDEFGVVPASPLRSSCVGPITSPLPVGAGEPCEFDTERAACTAPSVFISPAPCSKLGKPRSVAVLVSSCFTSAGDGVCPAWVSR